MEIMLIIMIIETISALILNNKYEDSKFKNKLLSTENYNLKRAMYENGLIPKEFLKGHE